MENNGWTGGQYSAVRALFGLYLGGFYLALIPEIAELLHLHVTYPWQRARGVTELIPNPFVWAGAPLPIALLLIAGALLALALALGLRDREAAWLLLWFDVALALFSPKTMLTFAPLIGARWLALVLVGLLPRAPYGSLAAGGRVDPAGGWHWPGWLRQVAWFSLIVGTAAVTLPPLLREPSLLSGNGWIEELITGPLAGGRARLALLPLPVRQGLELFTLYAPLAFLVLAPWRRARAAGWLLLFLAQLILQLLLGTWVHGIGLLLLLALMADPDWLPPCRTTGKLPVLFYDGSCALCHGAVRFGLAEDRLGQLRFAPLGGTTFDERIPEGRRAALPDSLVWSDDGESIELRSRAVLRAAAALGGLWRLTGALLWLVPRPLLDAAYDGVAAIRRKLAPPPPDACPMLPDGMRDRVLD